MSVEETKTAQESAENIEQPKQVETKNVLTFEEAQKLADHKAELARVEAVEQYKKQLEEERKQALLLEQEQKRNNLIEEIKNDESKKKAFENIKADFEKASFEWLEGVTSALEFQKKEFQGKNTTKPVSAGVVSDDVSNIDFFEWMKQHAKNKGGKKW